MFQAERVTTGFAQKWSRLNPRAAAAAECRRRSAEHSSVNVLWDLIIHLTSYTPRGYLLDMDNQNSKKRLIKRLRIISGQITGIEKMIEGDKYCVDIIT